MELSTNLYQEIAKDNEKRIFHNWHGSSISECPKAHYYKRLGVPEISIPGAGKMLRWKVGHLVEAAIRPYLQKVYPNLISNVRFTNEELDLTGEIDNYDPQSKTIVEIKSVGPRAVRYKKVTEDRHHLKDDGPYLSHELQQHAYVTLMSHTETECIESRGAGAEDVQLSLPLKVEKITYLYISLEGLIVPYTSEVKPELLENVSKRLEALNTAWAAQTPPDCICKPEHPLWGAQMQFCGYRNATTQPGVDCCSDHLLTKFKGEK